MEVREGRECGRRCRDRGCRGEEVEVGVREEGGGKLQDRNRKRSQCWVL